MSGKTPQSSGRATSTPGAASSAMHPNIPRTSSSSHPSAGSKSSPNMQVTSPTVAPAAAADNTAPRRTAAKRPPTSDSQSLESLNRQVVTTTATSLPTPKSPHPAFVTSELVRSLGNSFGETYLGVQRDLIRGSIQKADSPISTSTDGPQVMAEMYSNNYILIELEYPCVDAFNRGALIHSPESKLSLERVVLSKVRQRMEKSGSLIATPTPANTQSLRLKAFKSSTTNWRGGVVKKSLNVKQSIEPAETPTIEPTSSRMVTSHVPLSNGHLPFAPHSEPPPSEDYSMRWPTNFQRTFRDVFTTADRLVEQESLVSYDDSSSIPFFVCLLQYIISFVSANSSTLDTTDGSTSKGILGVPLMSALEGHVASETPLSLLTLLSLLRYISFPLDETFFGPPNHFLANLNIQAIDDEEGAASTPLGDVLPAEVNFDISASAFTSSDAILPLYTSKRWFDAFAPLQILHLARCEDGDFANTHLLMPTSSPQTSVESIVKLHNSEGCRFFFLCSSSLPNFGCFLPFADAEKIVEEFYCNLLPSTRQAKKKVSSTGLSSVMTRRRVLMAPRFFPECSVGEYLPSPHVVLAYPDCLDFVLRNASVSPPVATPREDDIDEEAITTWVFQPSATCITVGTMIPSFDEHTKLWSHYHDLVCADYVSAKQALSPNATTSLGRVSDPPGGYFSMTIPVLEL